MWRWVLCVPLVCVALVACESADPASGDSNGAGGDSSGGASDGGGTDGSSGDTGEAEGGGAADEGGGAGGGGGTPEAGGAGGGETVPVSGLCSETDEATCFAQGQGCLGSAGDCVELDELATCAEAESLAAREAEGPLLGARSFVSRDDVSDALCQIGIDGALLPAGATFAHVLRIQFRDAEADGLSAPISNSELPAKVELVANIGTVEDRTFGSGLEGGGANGFFNITLCLDQSYAAGDLTFAVRIPDAAGNLSNPLCVTYAGGMNGSRD